MIEQKQRFQDMCKIKGSAGDGSFAIAFAILELASAQENTAAALRMLGLADATTPLGAIEALLVQVKETGETIADALRREAE